MREDGLVSILPRSRRTVEEKEYLPIGDARYVLQTVRCTVHYIYTEM